MTLLFGKTQKNTSAKRTFHQVVTEIAFATPFIIDHNAPLDINTDSKVASNATQVEIKSYLKRIVPKVDEGLMTLQYPAD